MAGTKRAAEDDTGPATRSSKNPKTEKAASPKAKKGGKKGAKAALPASQFKAKALPLHVSLTHTPPKIAEDDSAKDDSGLIGSLTLVPSTFSTGSYGWKGSKQIVVELQNDDKEDGKEKVRVMLTFNATVMGSKDAAADEAEGKDADGETEPAEHSAAVEM